MLGLHWGDVDPLEGDIGGPPLTLGPVGVMLRSSLALGLHWGDVDPLKGDIGGPPLTLGPVGVTLVVPH